MAVQENGEVAEWFKAHAWKVCLPERVTGVRIPPSPPALPAQRASVQPDRMPSLLEASGRAERSKAAQRPQR